MMKILVWVFAAVIGVAAVYVLMQFGLAALGGFLAFLILLPFILVPILFHARHYQNPSRRYEAWDPEREVVPEEVFRNYRQTKADLVPLGFTVSGHYRRCGHVPGLTLFVTVWEHRAGEVFAESWNIFSGRITMSALVLRTLFENECKVVTTNSHSLWPLGRSKGRTGLYLPQVLDPTELYDIHQQVVESLRGAVRARPWAAEPANYLHDRWMKELNRGVEQRYYKLERSSGLYRPTWKGAILMTWKQLPRIVSIRKAWRRYQTKRLLEKLEENGAEAASNAGGA